jgi:hypothetical protein
VPHRFQRRTVACVDWSLGGSAERILPQEVAAVLSMVASIVAVPPATSAPAAQLWAKGMLDVSHGRTASRGESHRGERHTCSKLIRAGQCPRKASVRRVAEFVRRFRRQTWRAIQMILGACRPVLQLPASWRDMGGLRDV